MVNALKFFVPYAVHLPSYKLGRWDGTVSFCSVAGASYINLLDKLLPIVIDAGYEIEIEDKRESKGFSFPVLEAAHFSDKNWPKGHVNENEPIVLRDYQIEVINTFLDNLQCLQEVATGAGKTLITAALSSLVEPYGRTIVIVPNKSLVKQTEEDYRNLGLDVGVFYGDRKEYDKKHTICTWQSLGIFAKNSRAGETDQHIKDWLTDVVCVMVDEVHSAKAQVLKDLLTGPFAKVPIRWGLTGTIPKEDFEFTAILGAIGPVKYRLAAHELQEQGVLADLHILVVQMLETKQFKTWHAEHDYLLTDDARLKWIANFIKEVSVSGNTLVLFDRIECGEKLQALLPNAKYVHGGVKTEERKDQYTEVNVGENEIILATSGVAAVGINIPRIFNLIMLEPGKSFVRTIQSIGRGIRKAQDKDFLNVYDVCSSIRYSKTHLAKRKKYYTDAKYPFTIEKVDWVKES
jgi:superfamily II DNA or RNA helicase